MKMSTTIVMLVLFVAVVAVFAILDWTGAPTTEEQREYRDRVLAKLAKLDKKDVAKVEIKLAPKDDKENKKAAATRKAGGRTVVFQRKGEDRWQMIQPIDVLADSGNVDSVINDLKTLKRKARTPVILDAGGKPLTLSEYGLSDPKLLVTLTTTDGTTTRLAVGGETATEDGLYVRDLDETPTAVQVIDKYGISSFREKKLVDFRQKKLTRASSFNADQFAVSYPDKKIDIAGVKKDGDWTLTKPIADKGDGEKIRDNVVSKITDLKVDDEKKDFVNDAPSDQDLKTYGLDKPRVTLVVGETEKGDKDKKVKKVLDTILIGKALPDDKDKVYAKLEGQKYVVAVKAEILQKMADVKIADLRDKAIVEVDKDKVDRVEIALAKAEPLVMERVEKKKEKKKDDSSTSTDDTKEYEWKITKPKAYDADKDAIEDLVTKVKDLKADDFIDGKPAKDYGLETPALTLTFREGKSTSATGDTKVTPKTKTLVFGTYKEKEKQQYVKRDPKATTICLVDISEDLKKLLDGTALSYRNKKLLDYKSDRATRLTVTRDGVTFEMKKEKVKTDDKEEEKWRLLKPVKGPTDWSVSSLASALCGLKAEKLVTEDKQEFDKYGVGSKPRARATVTLKEADGKPAKQITVLLGAKVDPKSDSSNAYARVADQDLVFELSNYESEKFTDEFRDTKMFEFESDKLEKITLRWPDGKRFVATKKDDKYTVVEPKGLKDFEEQKVKDVVSEMRWMRANRFVSYTGAPKPEWGLGKPRLTVVLDLKDNKTVTVRIGAADKKDKDKGYVSVSDFEPTALAGLSAMKKFIEKGLAAFQKEKEEKKKDEAKEEGGATTQPAATQPAATQPAATTKPAGK